MNFPNTISPGAISFCQIKICQMLLCGQFVKFISRQYFQLYGISVETAKSEDVT